MGVTLSIYITLIYMVGTLNCLILQMTLEQAHAREE